MGRRAGARRPPHGDVHAGERARSDARVVLDLAAVERRLHHPGDRVGDIGREPATGQVDEARDVAVAGLGHREDADALALLQPDDAEGEVVQLVGLDLEQLVTREGLEHGPQLPPGVRVGDEPGPFEHVGGALAQHGGVEHALSVRRRREQPDDPILSRDRAGLVEAPHGDAGEPGRPVNGAAGIGAADRQQPTLQRHRRIGMMRPRQETEARAVLEEEIALCVDGVRRRAEQDEAPIDQPPEERSRHGDLSGDPRIAAVAVLELVGQCERHAAPSPTSR